MTLINQTPRTTIKLACDNTLKPKRFHLPNFSTYCNKKKK